MVDEVELNEPAQRVLTTVAALEADGEVTTPDAIADRAGLDTGTVRTALSHLINEADLVRELDPEADVVGPRYSVKGSAAPR